MIIASYNVNGIRAALRKGFLEWADSSRASVICLQEIRATPEQVDPSIFAEEGWYVQFFSATRPGYSGTAILSRAKPLEIVHGSSDPLSNNEGRITSLVIDHLSIMSVYVPSGGTGTARQEIKMKWLEDFDNHTRDFLKPEPEKTIIAGDFNICHQEVDIHNPKGLSRTSGFLPEEREWMDNWMYSHGLVDTFRLKNPTAVQYSWWSQRGRARAKNLGWRIDYVMASAQLAFFLKNAWVDLSAQCSDHCPTFAEFEI